MLQSLAVRMTLYSSSMPTNAGHESGWKIVMSSNTPANTRRKLRQFGIKQLLLLTTLAALLSVPLSIFIRSLPAEKRPRAFAGIMIAIAIGAATIYSAFVRRGRAEKIAGPLRVRLPTNATFSFHVANIVSCIGLAAVAGGILYLSLIHI